MQLTVFLQGRDTISILTFRFNIPPEWFLNFFVLMIQKVCFPKKTTWQTWWHAGSAVYIIYILPKGQLYSYAWLCYIKDAFFRIDASSDLDSQGRFSRGDVILVGINLFRHWFRMDLSFNQFSLTEQLGLFYEKEVQQLLICCLIASQLAFLNWRTGRGFVRR